MTTAEQIKYIFTCEVSCHPSREEYIRTKTAIEALADEIDALKEVLSRVHKDRPDPRGISPYDLSNQRRRR